jgi:hypothetical protein
MNDCIHDLAAGKSAEKLGRAATARGCNGGHGLFFLMASFAVKVRKILSRLLTKKKAPSINQSIIMNNKTRRALRQ